MPQGRFGVPPWHSTEVCGVAQHPGSPMGQTSPLWVLLEAKDGVKGRCGEGWGVPWGPSQHYSTQQGMRGSGAPHGLWQGN